MWACSGSINARQGRFCWEAQVLWERHYYHYTSTTTFFVGWLSRGLYVPLRQKALKKALVFLSHVVQPKPMEKKRSSGTKKCRREPKEVSSFSSRQTANKNLVKIAALSWQVWFLTRPPLMAVNTIHHWVLCHCCPLAVLYYHSRLEWRRRRAVKGIEARPGCRKNIACVGFTLTRLPGGWWWYSRRSDDMFLLLTMLCVSLKLSWSFFHSHAFSFLLFLQLFLLPLPLLQLKVFE